MISKVHLPSHLHTCKLELFANAVPLVSPRPAKSPAKHRQTLIPTAELCTVSRQIVTIDFFAGTESLADSNQWDQSTRLKKEQVDASSRDRCALLALLTVVRKGPARLPFLRADGDMSCRRGLVSSCRRMPLFCRAPSRLRFATCLQN